MRRWIAFSWLILAGWLASPGVPVHGQSMAPAFSTNYSVVPLGSVTNVPGPYGGLIFSANDPNRLILGGASATSGGKLYSVQVARDTNQHIVGFLGSPTVFASVPFNEGGVAYAAGGVLLAAQSTNAIGQIKSGSSVLNKVVGLHPLGVTNSPGGLTVVPPGFPGAGQLKILDFTSAEFYAATLSPDGAGTFDVSGVRGEAQLPYYSAFFSMHSRLPEGFLYLPPGKPGFTDYSTLLVCETDSGRGLIGDGVVAAYHLDADGAPVPSSRAEFVIGLEPKGITVDPLTGDLLISTFSPSLFIGTDSIVAVRGGAPVPTAAISLTPTQFTNDYTGSLVLHVSGLTNSQTVVVETFLDISNTGTIAASDPLYQSFSVTDGAVPTLGGVTNVNLPFDTDGAANGQITVAFPLHGDFGMDKASGHYLVRVSSPTGAFAPLVTSYQILPATYPQGVSGSLLDSTTANPVSGAVVALLDLASIFGNSGTLDLSQTHLVGSGFTDNQGRYTDYCPPGYYLALALRIGYFSVLPVHDLPALFSALIDVQTGQWTAHGATVTPGILSISGTLTSDQSGAGLPGVMLFAIGQATNGLEFAFAFTDAHGAFQIPVNAAQWSLALPPLALARLGCVTLTNLPVIDTSTGSVAGVSLTVPVATHPIYGRLTGTTGAPLANVRVDAISTTSTNEYTSTFTDQDGWYVLGVTAGNWTVRPDPKTVDSLGYEQQVSVVTVSGTLAVLVNIIFEPIPSPDPGSLVWHWQNPLPQGNNLAGVVFGNGAFVAVGDHGTILRSLNGRQWQPQTSGTVVPLNGVTFANGRFVAVGGEGSGGSDYGVVLVSTNGVNWTSADPGASGQLQAVAFGNGLFVAVGDGGVVTSPDGLNWQLRSGGTSDSSWLRVVAFGNGAFVTGGDNFVIWTSTNGVQWTPALTNNQAMTSLGFGNGEFVAQMGGAWISTNGRAWTSVGNTGFTPLGVIWYQGAFYAVGGSSGAATSLDGTNWTMMSLPPPIDQFQLSALTSGSGAFAAVGASGTLAYSTDGTNWSAASSGRLTPFTDIAFGREKFVAADSQANILNSVDGSAWALVYSGNRFGNIAFSRLFSAGGMLFASGTAGQVASLDGQHWWPDSPLGAVAPNGIVYANGSFVAVGNQGVFTSPDGLHWQAPSPGLTNGLNAVAYGNGLFVAIDASTCWTSPDGAYWSPAFDAGTLDIHSLQDLAFANGRFVAVSYDGAAMVSMDGAHWTAAIVPPGGQITRLVSGPGMFVAAGDNLSVSVDGWHWTPARTDLPHLGGIAYGNQRYVVVGDNGAVLDSDPVADLAPMILTSPQSHTVTAGLPLTLTVNAQSTLGLTYQWLKNSVPISGATNATLGLPGVQALDAGKYTVQVANVRASVLSDPAWVQLAPAGPSPLPVEPWHVLPTSVSGTNTLYSLASGWSPGFYSANAVTVAVGDNATILISANAGPWTAEFAPTTNALTGVTFGQVIVPLWGNEEFFVAVGDAGTILQGTLDNWGGIQWQKQTSGTTNLLERVAYGNGLFVAVGDDGTLLTSTNSTEWTSRTSGTGVNLLGVAVGFVNSNLLAVAVGDNGTLLTSTNGSDWTRRDSGLTNSLFGAGFCGGQFVVVGAGGAILTSTDAVTWHRQVTPVSSDLWSVASGEGYFVAVGAEGTILSSPDAVHWTQRSAGTSATLYEVAVAEGAFWAVGDGGTILYSDSLVALRWISVLDGQLGLFGPPGHFYRVESTGEVLNPTDWSWETTVYFPSNSPPETPAFLPSAASATTRFFRAVLTP